MDYGTIAQELGDFALLINSGVSRIKAFVLNGISSLAMILGACLAWVLVDHINKGLPFILSFTASGFIYIAVADLMPSLHRRVRFGDTVNQLVLIFAGIVLVWSFNFLESS
ncbi:MAG: ZIP family metal transporter [Pseudomonadota bacterium]